VLLESRICTLDLFFLDVINAKFDCECNTTIVNIPLNVQLLCLLNEKIAIFFFILLCILYYRTFPEAGGVNFASWLIFGAPLMLINMLAAWLWLQILFMGLFR
jgi:hypothetical protein